MIDHALICGFGSIGRRHFRHLRRLGCSRIDVYRTGKGTLHEMNAEVPDRVFTNLDEALRESPELVIIANPTSLHVPTALKAVQYGCHVLIEKPLSHSLEDVDRLIDECSRKGVRAGVAYNLRFHPIVRTLKEYLSSEEKGGGPYMARIHVGSYMPEWHPWEDYRVSYAARRELGGGSALTNSHEIDLALWLLGPVRSWSGKACRLHPLQTDVDEASAFLLEHESGAVSTVTLNFLQHQPQRTIDIIYDKTWIHADLIENTITVYKNKDSKEKQTFPTAQIDDTYADELMDFISWIEGEKGICATLEEGKRVLEIACSIELD